MRSGILATGLILALSTSSLGQGAAGAAPAADSAKPKAPSGPAHVTLQPFFAVNSGYTKYKMDVSGDIEGSQVRLESELKFPMDVTVAGAKVSVDLPDGVWRLEGEFWASVNDPSDKMTDGDWITSGDRLMFSYTESNVTMEAYQMRIGLMYTAHRGPKWLLGLPAGFQYQKITQEVMGYEGWQLDSNLQRVAVSGTEHAIHYEVKYSTCYLGFRGEIRPSPHLQINIEGDGCYFWGKDFDDHLLRGKTGTADGTGSGGKGTFDLRYWFGAPGRKAQPFISLNAELMYLSASMKQTQHWYLAEEGVEAGTSISGIPHKVTTQQTRIGGSVGIRF